MLLHFFCLKWINSKWAQVWKYFWFSFSGRLFIADTNNSLIRYLDLNNDDFELRTLELKGFQPPKSKRSFKRLRRRPSADTVTVTIDAISSNEGNLSIEISLPNEYHFSKVLIILLSFRHCNSILCIHPRLYMSLTTALKFHCRKHAVDLVLIPNLQML